MGSDSSSSLLALQQSGVGASAKNNRCDAKSHSFRCELKPSSRTAGLQTIPRQLLFLDLTGNNNKKKNFKTTKNI